MDENKLLDGSEAVRFYGTWKSRVGFFSALFLVFTAVCLFLAVRKGDSALLVFAPLALCCLALALWFGKQLLGQRPLIEFNSKGILSRAFRERFIAWEDITDLNVQTMHGSTQMQVVLVPSPARPNRPSLWRRNPVEVLIPLTALSEAGCNAVFEQGLAAFRRYNPNAATQAILLKQEEWAQNEAFEQSLKEMTPRVWAVPLIVAICTLVWGLGISFGLSPLQPTAYDLFLWGGNTLASVQQGEYWRLLTAMFLHAGVIHLAVNMFALWESGMLLGRLQGNLGFLVVYVCAGLLGSALSLYFSAANGISVGASGAVFGVAGALLAIVLLQRGKFPLQRAKQLQSSLAVFILYSLIYGFTRSGIDNACHVGGLLAGFVCGVVLTAKANAATDVLQRRWRLLLAALVCGLAVVGLVFFSPPAKRDFALVHRDTQSLLQLQPDIEQRRKLIVADSKQATSGKLSSRELLQRMQDVHLPELRRQERALAALNLPTDEKVGKFARAQREWLAGMIALFDATIANDRQPSPEGEQQIKQLTAALLVKQKALEELLQTKQK